jgi:hypothetical protein
VEYKIREENGETVIEIRTKKKAAAVIKTENEERIYLPETEPNQTNYYADSPEGLTSTEKGYKLKHPDSIDEIEIFSK